jgi:hypothetical protein
MCIDGCACVIRPTHDRFNALMRDTLSLLDAPSIDKRALQTVVGGWTWIALLRRPLLSLLHKVYRFVSVIGDRHFRVWPSVRAELCALLALLPCCVHNMRAPAFAEQLATDASEEKQALVTAPLPALDAERALLWEMALAPSASLLPPSCRSPPPPASLAAEVLQRIQRTSVQGIRQPALASALPAFQHADGYALVAARRWTTIISAAWRFPQHINLLELHAVLSALRWLASRPCAHGTRVLCWIDNAVTAYGLKKGRAHSLPLQALLRHAAVLQVVSGIRLFPLWIPTACNPADRPSRSPS